MLLRSNFSSFPQYFQHISNFKCPITYTFVKCGCSIYFFLKSANLICRSTDISKYFRESFGIRDNESRLYYHYYYYYYYYLVPFACTGGGGAITAVTSCMQHPSTISTTYLETLTDAGAVAGNIDRTSHMLNDRIYIFDGISDTVVDPGMCNLIFLDCS